MRGAIRQAENAKNQNIVVLIGNTGTGKSTAVHNLAGRSVVWDKENKCMKVVGEEIAKIGHKKATSETLYTNVYPKHPIEGTKLVWADAEGFFFGFTKD